jgi:hypothetical protein
MEVPQAVVKGSYPAEDGCAEQIGLGVKGPALWPLLEFMRMNWRKVYT